MDDGCVVVSEERNDYHQPVKTIYASMCAFYALRNNMNGLRVTRFHNFHFIFSLGDSECLIQKFYSSFIIWKITWDMRTKLEKWNVPSSISTIVYRLIARTEMYRSIEYKQIAGRLSGLIPLTIQPNDYHSHQIPDELRRLPPRFNQYDWCQSSIISSVVGVCTCLCSRQNN